MRASNRRPARSSSSMDVPAPLSMRRRGPGAARGSRRRDGRPRGGARARGRNLPGLARRPALREVLRPQPARAAVLLLAREPASGRLVGMASLLPSRLRVRRPAGARRPSARTSRSTGATAGSGRRCPCSGPPRALAERGPGLRLRLPESALRADRQAGGLRERRRADALREGAAAPPAGGPLRGPPRLARMLSPSRGLRGPADLARLQGAARAPAARALVREAGRASTSASPRSGRPPARRHAVTGERSAELLNWKYELERAASPSYRSSPRWTPAGGWPATSSTA